MQLGPRVITKLDNLKHSDFQGFGIYHAKLEWYEVCESGAVIRVDEALNQLTMLIYANQLARVQYNKVEFFEGQTAITLKPTKYALRT